MLAEVAASIAERPGRAALTVLGTVLGVASFVAVLGLTGSANAQIAETFNAQSAREVSVIRLVDEDRPVSLRAPDDFSEQGLARVRDMAGVDAAGVRAEWIPGAQVSTRPGDDGPAVVVPVVAIDSQFWEASRPRGVRGRTTAQQKSGARVVVIGEGIADSLGGGGRHWPRFVYIDGVQFTVAGVVGGSDRDPASRGTVYLDIATARGVLGPRRSATPAELLIAVDLGAARSVAQQVSVALEPTHPEWFDVGPVSEPTKVRDRVSDSLRRLFVLLAVVSLMVGALGIANTTLVSVLARRPEIGLRRAMGALPRHVLAQVLGEASLLGALGGLLGGLIGLAATVIVALVNGWTAVLPGWVLPAAPVLGAVTGLVAGVHPAFKAARMEPADALRQG